MDTIFLANYTTKHTHTHTHTHTHKIIKSVAGKEYRYSEDL